MGTKMNFVSHVVELFKYFPGKIGDKIRLALYSQIFKKIGKSIEIKDGVTILCAENVEMGDYSAINQNCYLNAYGGIVIGKHVRMAPHSALISTNHKFDRVDIPMSLQGENPGKIVIGDDVWIGYGATILRNVKIGRGSIIGPNAVVRKDVPEFSIVVNDNLMLRRK